MRLLLALLAGVLLAVGPATARAQGQVTWDAPVNLSESPTSSEAPAILADPYGTVHVLWSENLVDAALARTNAIMYTRWDGQTWSPARDVLLAPEGIGSRAGEVSVAFGRDGELYVVFVGSGNGSVYFSSSPVTKATAASAWRKPALLNESVRGGLSPRIAVDTDGTIHVAFCVSIGSQQGMYYSRSTDSGRTWSDLQKIPDSQIGEDASLFDARIAVDTSGTLHAAWSWAGYPETYPPKGIWYSRSTDKGDSWSVPELVADGPFRTPDLATQANGAVHLFWSGTLTQRFKYHQTSLDGGLTWGQPWVFRQLGGLQGYAGAAEDSRGSLHLVMATNHVDAVPEVLVHTQWDGTGWTEPEIILRDTHGYSLAGEDLLSAAIAVTGGNTLHVVVQYPIIRTPKVDQQRDIFYLRGHTQAPYVEPAPSAENAITNSPTAGPAQVATVAAPPVTAGPVPVVSPAEIDTGPPDVGAGSLSVLVVGAGSTLVVLLAAALIHRARR